jgi:tetratricopeptide (TPR) repeat protein
MTLDDYLKPLDIHEEKHQSLVRTPLFIVVGVIIFLLQALNTYLLLWAGMWPIVAFFFHVAMVVACLLFAATERRLEGDARFPLLLAVTTFALGPFGAFGCVLAVLLDVIYSRYAQNFSEWFASIFPQADHTLSEETYENISTGRDLTYRDYSVQSFMEVMSIGSEGQKRSALGRMTLLFNPRFAGAFRKALTDSSNTIRVQAATAVVRIENGFLQRALKISRILKFQPNNPDIKLALARHYDDYAFTGVLDPERENANRKRALESYMEYLKLRPDDNTAKLSVGRLLMHSGDTAAAADWFAKSIADRTATDAMVGWYMECLFLLGRTRELRAVASQHLAQISNIPDMAESVKLWLGAAVPQMPAKVLTLEGARA